MKKMILLMTLLLFTKNVFALGTEELILIQVTAMKAIEEIGLKVIGDNITKMQADLAKQIQDHIGKDTKGYGNSGYKAGLQTWGSDTDKWENILTTGGSGELAAMVGKFKGEYKIEKDLVENASLKGSRQASYYELQAKTAIAARASSQYVFDKIQANLEYQDTLRKQIDATKDLKSSVDLQNRIQVENNFLMLQLIRLLAVNTQQQAIGAQAEANATVDRIKILK